MISIKIDCNITTNICFKISTSGKCNTPHWRERRWRWGRIIQQFCSLSQCLLIKCSLKFDESTPSFCHERRVDSCDRAMTGLLTAVWKIPVEISPWRESWVTGPLSWASTSRDTCHSVGPWQAPATVSLTSLTHQPLQEIPGLEIW